jgi:NADH:ubiquinone oxidoreductase subunit C
MIDKITSLLKSKFADSLLSIAGEDKAIVLLVKKEKAHQILSELKDAGFNHLSDVSAVDYIN